MSHCVEKIGHSCGSRRGLQVFEEDGKYTGYCFACDTFIQDPYGDRPKGFKPKIDAKSPEAIQAEIDEITAYPCVDIPLRRLRADTLSYYGVRVAVSEVDGVTPIAQYFPYYEGGKLLGYKAKILENKQFFFVGPEGALKNADLFGWEQAIGTGAKRLIITEGENDAIALRKILQLNTKNEYQDSIPAVVSLISGSGSAGKTISRLSGRIKAHFPEVILAFDMDEAGRKAVEDVCKIFPTALSATLPCKDANECLMQGKGKACFNAVTFRSEQPKNTRLIMGSSLREAARKEPEWGYSWPWKALNEATRGFRLGETWYLGGGVKMGKSEVVNAIAAHCIREHKWPVFMAKPEEANKKTYQMLVGKMAGKIYHDPKIPFDYESYDKYEPQVGDNAILVNLYQHLGWDTLKSDIYDASRLGCKAVFIDPITNLTNQIGTGEANEKLTSIAADLSAMMLDLQMVAFIFCHLKAPEGVPHEMGGRVFSTQFAGSRAMMRSCNGMIGIEGNKDPALPENERHIRTLVLLEDREFGQTGRFPLFWNKDNGLFTEI